MTRMDFRYHFDLTFGALKRWFIAQCYDSLLIAALWLVGLFILKVPLAPFWAVLAGALQFVPNFGPILSIVGPAVSLIFSNGSWERFLGLFIAYAVITVIDGLILQPFLMKRQNKVPFWASLLAPLVLGIVFPFWGVLLAPPLLAIIYAYRGRKRIEGVRAGEGIILPPEEKGAAFHRHR